MANYDKIMAISFQGKKHYGTIMVIMAIGFPKKFIAFYLDLFSFSWKRIALIDHNFIHEFY